MRPPGLDPRPQMATEAEAGDPWERLSPRMLLVHPLHELVRLAPVLVGVLVAGSRSGQGPRWALFAVGVTVLLGVGRWLTTTYRVTAQGVEIRTGLVRRRVLTAPLDRVRTVELTSTALQRVLSLARVEIGTGYSGARDRSGLRLDALDVPTAAHLREELLARRGAPQADRVSSPEHLGPVGPEPDVGSFQAQRAGRPGGPEEPQLVARTRLGWLRYAPFTLSGVVTVGVAVGGLSRSVTEGHLDPLHSGPLRGLVKQLADGPPWSVVLVAGLFFLAAVIVVSVLGYAVAFGNFRLTRPAAGTLRVSRGLLTHRATDIAEGRLRGVELEEPLLLRAVGGARCSALTVPLHAGRSDAGRRSAVPLLPPAPGAEALRVAAEVLGGPSPVTAPLVAHGRRAAARRRARALLPAAAVVVAATAFTRTLGGPDVLWIASVALLPAAAGLAADRARNLGHALVDGWLVTRQGSIVRRRSVLACHGIVGWTLRQSLTQRRAGLVTLVATTGAGVQHYDVPDVELGAAIALAEGALPGLLAPFIEQP